MNNKLKRVIAAVLSLVFIFSMCTALPFSADAAIDEIDIRLTIYPRSGDRSSWGHPSLNFKSGWNVDATDIFYAKAAGNMDMKVAYCMQPNVWLMGGDKSPEILPEDFFYNYDNGVLNHMEIQSLMGRVFHYGFTGTVTTSLSNSEVAELVATQVIVWEIVVGERDMNFGYVTPPAHLDEVKQIIKNNHPLRSEIFAHYDRIVNSVQNHTRLPSFMRDTPADALVSELIWDGSKYSATFTDSNNVIGNFSFSTVVSGVSCQVSGNQLIVSSDTAPSDQVQVICVKNGAKRSAVTFWCSNKITVKGSVQGLVMSGQEISDPVGGYLKLKVSYGSMDIVKTSKNNDGRVDGFQFRVSKDGNVIGTYTSGVDGRINVPNLVAGWYKVEEINLSDDYVKPFPNPVDVEVKAGQVATVNFNNIKKLGTITVVKTNNRPLMGDYSLEGAEFSVKDSNGKVVDTIKTDSTGRGNSIPLPLSTYTIFEEKAPYGFIRDKTVYTRTLSGSQGTAEVVYCPELGIPEKPQVGKITINKMDAETANEAQGDATLSHAVFDLFDPSGKLVERLYCGNAKSVTSKEVPLGNGYLVKEVTPPSGYTLTQKEHVVNIEYADQDVEVNLKSTDVKNTVIKGKIALIKHSNDPDSQVDPENLQVQQPLAGIKFYVYLKNAGSYENAKSSERDLLITNENGWSLSKNLPYGTYVVAEDPNGAPEHKVCAPFDAYITENERTYYFNVENPIYTGKVKIVKTDAETGKIIKKPNIEFKVKNVETGKWVEQEILYPTPVIISSYLTNEEGWLVMPQELRFGNYELWEQKSAYGYLISEDPIPFKVTAENPVAFLEVKFPNKPAMGCITVEKTGEMLVGANEIDGKIRNQFIPQYEISYLANATFDIIARNNIVTPDGTVRVEAGTVVDTVTTKSDGKVSSKLLYLGDYYIVERSVPFGMVLNTNEFDVSLIYADQNTPVVYEQVGVYNERQRAEVSIEKSCEIPENPPEDFNPYESVHFGLFAREDIKIQDGTTVIPKDGLLEFISFDETGKTTLKTDLPMGCSFYVQELMSGAGYILDENQYDFKFEYGGQDESVIKIAVNEGDAIENKLQRGGFKLIKTFEGKDYPISDIPFHITGHTTVGTIVEMDVTTDENGEINLEELLVGEYVISELDCDLSAGYVLTLDQAFTVALDEITDLTIENKLMRGDLTIIKTFEGKSVPLSNIPFTIVGKTIVGSDYEETLMTDEDGKISITDLLVGEYRIRELECDLSVGYVLSEEQTAVIANEKIEEMKIENKLIRGNVRLVKVDSESRHALSGAEFKLYDPEGNLIGTHVSDANGVVMVENLAYGSGYKFVETKSPTGYKLDQTEIRFDILENNKTIEIEATNTFIPADIPKTGEDGLPILGCVLIALFSSISLATIIIRRRRKTA